MPIYIYKGNSQISTNAVRNDKAVKAIYAKEQGKDAVCVWGIDTSTPYDQMFAYSIVNNKINITGLESNVKSNYITIPNKISGKLVTSIETAAFRDQNKILSITVPDSVTSIGYQAFYNCSKLTSITIPDSVTSFGSEAFSGCTGLTSVTIGNGATNIGTNAFLGCTNLMRVTLGNGAKNIGKRAFWKCTSLTSVTIGNGTKSIDDSVFGDCYNLTDITIPDSVESISGTALSDTTWYDNQPNGLVYAGQVFYKYKGRMPSNTSVTLREGTLGISDDACYDCAGLTSITIPDSVTNIRSRAFSYCTRLTSITFNGTKAQWNTITKGSSWNSNTGNYTIHCTDGDIPK